MSKKPKNYPSTNAMLRGMMPRRKADAMIDSINDLLVSQNLDLLGSLKSLVDDCTSDSPSGVSCPDKRILRKAKLTAKKYGAVFTPKL